eukprot:CCRYP_016106-RA/>CCRYP_016106-RA protein AED:0.11 eAED:0.25 QI:0/0/0/1/0.2/0.16/6/0/1395
MLGFYATADGIPEYINMLEAAQRKLARANLPMSDDQLLAIASTAVLASNHFPRPTDDWEAKPRANKTWTAWKTHYRAAHIARKRQLLASGIAMPPSTANALIAEDDVHLTEGTFARLDGYLDNLAAAATTERTTLQSLTEANAALVANLTALTTSVAGLTAAYTSLAAVQHASVPPGTATQQPRRTRANTRPLTTLPAMPGGYCWTHGFRVREGHSSATCANKAEGHKDTATRANTMGGSMVNKGSPLLQSDMAIADTGASGHYFLPEAPLTNINAHAPRTTIRTATGQPLYSTGTATLNLPTIPPVTQHGHIVPGLTHNLISIGTLCDAGCTALFTANALTVTDAAGTTILSGARDTNAPRLWKLSLRPHQDAIALHVARPRATLAPTQHKETHVDKLAPTHIAKPPTCPRVHTHLRTHDLPTTRALVAFLHATAGYPVKSTWLQAIKRGFYNSWPGLTYTLVAKYCPTADATIQGHMAQPRQHIRSTKRATFHQQTTPASPQHDIDIFTYIMIAFHSDTNAILVRPFPNKHDVHRIAAYQDIHVRLCNANRKPMVHIMDNEASLAFRQAITSNGSTFQLVPPHVHRRNAAERAIRTFKDHFLAILAGTAPSFPADRWDLLIPHAELTLNLLRASHCNPTLSAWEDLFGPFNFDATPLGPAGCRILIHSKATTRRSWDYRSHEGFYHFTTIAATVYSTKNRSVAITDAIKFRHHYLPTPDLTAEDKIIAALQQLQLATKSPTAQLQAIYKLRDIFRHYATTATNPDTTPPRVQALPPRVPPEAPIRDTTLHPTPTTAWQTVPEHTRRGVPTTIDQPIAARTFGPASGHRPLRNSFAALADTTDNESLGTAMPVLDQDTGQLLEHKQLRRHPKHKATWDTPYSNELGRLCQGIGHHPYINTRSYRDIPNQRKGDVTYTRVVCEIRPQKLTLTARITLEATASGTQATVGPKRAHWKPSNSFSIAFFPHLPRRFASFDISNFYLGTPLDRPEYARIKLSDIPGDFVQEYSLQDFAHNVSKGVYGLKQAGKLANDLLTQRLEMHGYYQCATTPGLWRHKWRPVLFVLIVDDFGIQYSDRRHAEHLLQALQQHYTVTTDWTGTKFAGIDIKWDYNKANLPPHHGHLHFRPATEVRPSRPRKPQHAPHKHREIIYGAKEQLLPDNDTSPPLDAAGIKRIQGIVGSLLYYARAVDNKLLVALSTISSQQTAATQNTAAAVHQLLDYVATYPNDGITYRASSMILAAHSDASYLTEPGSRSRGGAHIFLSEGDPVPRHNMPVLTISQIIKYVMASAAEAELAALYITARELIPLRNALEEMGWTQPKTPIQTDNSTATGFVNDTIIQRRIKMIWMRLHWLRCREAQGQFRFYWDRGSANLADYSTKHHPPAYHLAHRPTHA